jgi:hypothetical protein
MPRDLAGGRSKTSAASWLKFGMLLPMKLVKDWLWAHSLLYPFLLFVFAALVSIYSREIKTFLHEWPRTTEQLRKYKTNRILSYMALLKSLHNNSYELVLYLAKRLLHDCYIAMIWFGVFVTAASWLRRPNSVWFGGLFIGGWLTGMFQALTKVTKDLSNYDVTIKRLEQKLAQHQPDTLVRVCRD